VQRAKDLEELVRDWFAKASRGDPSMVMTNVSEEPGVRLIGSDPSEQFRGAAVAEFLASEVANAGGHARFDPDDIEAFSEGSVGWATAQVRITLPGGQSVAPRWSAVLHREQDVWKFVQVHASFGVENDKVGWVYAT
jgi:ketosteroid isomerase-like protein